MASNIGPKLNFAQAQEAHAVPPFSSCPIPVRLEFRVVKRKVIFKLASVDGDFR